VRGSTIFALAPEITQTVWNVDGDGLMALLRDSGTFGILGIARPSAGSVEPSRKVQFPYLERRILEGITASDGRWAGAQGTTKDVMATGDQVKALIRSHADGDDARFYAIAMQVAAQAARSGHGKFAQELRELVDQVKARAKAAPPARGLKPVPLAQPRGELAGLLTVHYPKIRVCDMALTDALRSRLDRVLTEQRERDRLREHGFSPMRKLLLVGPPGTGKTMSAAALAGELGLPLFSIQLDGLITKYMGETAAKLRIVFDAIQSTRGVYLFDEFDALGGERGSKNDVGEIRRVLNSFLQFLEQDESDSLVLGATNHVGLLDRALFRRFDAVLEYALPTAEIATRVMRARLAPLDTANVDWSAAAKATEGLSHAEIAMACEQAAKNAILDHSTSVRDAELLAALEERRSTHA
jgi:SpoVK/Ycf46/Vps4 family AAA+-type ATPase